MIKIAYSQLINQQPPHNYAGTRQQMRNSHPRDHRAKYNNTRLLIRFLLTRSSIHVRNKRAVDSCSNALSISNELHSPTPQKFSDSSLASSSASPSPERLDPGPRRPRIFDRITKRESISGSRDSRKRLSKTRTTGWSKENFAREGQK